MFWLFLVNGAEDEPTLLQSWPNEDRKQLGKNICVSAKYMCGKVVIFERELDVHTAIFCNRMLGAR